MRTFFVLLLLHLSLFAYEENFNSYEDGTLSTKLSDSGITFSSNGTWKVFSTPFSIFSTPVLLEPSSTLENNPLSLSFAQIQCHIDLDFATDGDDLLDITGLYRGEEVYHEQVRGSNKGGSYVGSFAINTKLDAIRLYTVERKRLLIDNIKTTSCRLDSYSLSEGMTTHDSFEQDSLLSTEGVIAKAQNLTEPLVLSNEKDIKSMALWFKVSDVNAQATIIENTLDSNTPRLKLSINSDAKAQLDLDDSFFSPYVSDITIKPNQWTHLVLTREEEHLNLYLNGELHGSYTVASKIFQEGEQIRIGDTDFGAIDELRLYQNDLNATQITELFHTRESFTRVYEESFEAGKQFCISNPEACGLRVGSTSKDISLQKDIQTLQEGTFDVQWYLVSAANNNVYLISGDSNDSSVWQMVPETRQWKPVHNAGAFDGFEGQGQIFDSIIFSDDKTQITFGSELNTTEKN
jgi:hypothetical protein